MAGCHSPRGGTETPPNPSRRGCPAPLRRRYLRGLGRRPRWLLRAAFVLGSAGLGASSAVRGSAGLLRPAPRRSPLASALLRLPTPRSGGGGERIPRGLRLLPAPVQRGSRLHSPPRLREPPAAAAAAAVPRRRAPRPPPPRRSPPRSAPATNRVRDCFKERASS